MGRRKGNGGGIGALLLGALVVILLIPKEIWIALFWIAVVALLCWVGWRMFRKWQCAQQASVLPPPPEETGKTLAEILSESSGRSPPTARGAGGSASVLQVAPPPLPSTPAITLPAPRSQASTGTGRVVIEPNPPTPAHEPVPVRTTSPLGNWADNRDAVAAVNRVRSDELRAKIAASEADHKSRAPRLPAAEFTNTQSVEEPPADSAASASSQQSPWEIERDQVARENRHRSETLRAKFPEVRIVSEESTTRPASAATPDEGSRKRLEETGSVPLRSPVTDSIAPVVAPSSRPIPVQDPVPVRTTSPVMLTHSMLA